MKGFWNYAKKYDAVIGFSALTLLLFGACFQSVFAWLAMVFAFAFAIYLRNETKILGLMLYLHCFYIIFNYLNLFTITLDIVIEGFFIATLLGFYIYHLVKRELKINLKTLIPIVLFLIYVLLPFHECQFKDYFAVVFFFVFVYVVFEMRQRFDFRYVVRLFVVGLMVSCLFALMRDLSPLLSNKIGRADYFGIVRFQGSTFHANTLHGLIVIVICGIFLLKYQEKISWLELFADFVPLFIFGYLTLSRAFLATVLVAIIVFTLFYFFRNKVKSLISLVVFAAIICIAGGVFYDATKVYSERITNNVDTFSVAQSINDLTPQRLEDNFDKMSEEEQQMIWSGEMRFDPGRADLRALYLRDWSSSLKTMWLGRGISRPLIGQMSAHNLYIQELWKHGIVGYLFYLAMIAGAINWKKIKKYWKLYIPVLIFVIPYILATNVEQSLLDRFRLVIILNAVGFLEQIQQSKIDVSQSADKKLIE